MSLQTLLDDLQVLGDHRYRLVADPSWNQGPGLYGGLLAAAIGRACELEFPDWTVRALSLHLAAPAPHDGVEIELCEERRGSRTLFLSIRLRAAGQTVVAATATLALPRASDADFEHCEAPVLPDPSTIPDVFAAFTAAGVDVPGVPAYIRHFDFRIAAGVPYGGASVAETRGWIRSRETVKSGQNLVLGLLDSWPLAILSSLSRPRPVSSVVIHMQLFPPHAALSDDAFYCVDMNSSITREGYSDQTTSVFDRHGRLLGRATQLVAVIR